MILPVLYLMAAPQSWYISRLNDIGHLHIPVGPHILHSHRLYLTSTV